MEPVKQIPHEEPGTPESSASERGQMRAHVERLYAFAQTLTSDSAHAARLVETAYRRAYVIPENERPTGNERLWLMGFILQAAKEEGARIEESSISEASLDSAITFENEVALEEALARQLPSVMATLSPLARRLILLRDFEMLSNAQIASLLNLPEGVVAAEHAVARHELESGLRTMLSNQEIERFNEAQARGLLDIALHHAAGSAFAPAPPSLHLSIHAETAGVPVGKTPDVVLLQRRSRKQSPKQIYKQLLIALAVLFFAGAIGYLVTSLTGKPGPVDMIDLADQKAAAVEVEFKSENPEEVEQYFKSELDWRLTVPTIDDAAMRGAGIYKLSGDYQLPVLIFDDPLNKRQITVFITDYKTLDKAKNRLLLQPDVLTQIENDRYFDIHDMGKHQILVWRNRKNIYVAVTQGDVSSLRRRIVFPS